jgi:hypothetical protein
VVRYAFTAEDFHLIPPAGLPAHPSTPSFRATWRAGENLSCRSFLGKEFATSVYAMVRAAKFNRIHHKDAKAARPVGPCL